MSPPERHLHRQQHRSGFREAPTVCAGNGRLLNGAEGSEAAALLSEDPSAEEDGAQQTMVRVICSQRDRLKERVSQLGDELSKVIPILRIPVWSEENCRGYLAAPACELCYAMDFCLLCVRCPLVPDMMQIAVAASASL